MIGAVAQELVDQIAVGGVELHAVEAGGDRVARGLGGNPRITPRDLVERGAARASP